MAVKTQLPSKKLKVLMVATEASPYASVGGAGSVIAHLSKALVELGHDVRVFIPKFGLIDEQRYPMDLVVSGLEVPTGSESTPTLICNVKSIKAETGVTFYFLENQEYYEKRANIYGYSDDPTRFLLLSRGALEFIKSGYFVPDVIHCNDWHTGAIPNYLSTVYSKDPVIKEISSVFTIHNLHFQGNFDHKHVSELNYDDGKSPIESFFSERVNYQNFMKRGIIYADAVNTVSKTYSKEILTPDFGEGLDKLLLELKDKLFGIINGLDYEEFNPATDTIIEKNYDLNHMEYRVQNKKAVQKEFDLEINPDKFLIGYVGRLDQMKGVDLAVKVLGNLLREYDVQFIEVGGGDWGIVELLNGLKTAFPKKVGIHPYPNFALPRLLFAGCDVMLNPSRFEPCGIVQIESMRYGAIPIVRNVGGLSDTVENFDSQKKTGNGFVFDDFNEYSLYGQLVRAHEIYKNKKLWGSLIKNAMQSDYSWDYSAGEYVKLYDKSHFLKYKNEKKVRSGDLILS